MQAFASFPREAARGLRYVLHDIDDTITDGGKLHPEAYAALWALHNAGLKVIPVTGRPAGWCDMMLRQWPVDAVIGENGALAFYWEEGHVRRFLHPSIPADTVRAMIKEVAQACLKGVPGCRIAQDQFARLYDVAIDFREDPPYLSLEEANRIKQIATSMGAVAKVSSIHVNIWFGDYDKRAMARLFFDEIYGVPGAAEQSIFFGDSPNDAPMFAAFPHSCAVANIRPFLPQMTDLPAYITSLPGGEGFAEAARQLLLLREE